MAVGPRKIEDGAENCSRVVLGTISIAGAAGHDRTRSLDGGAL